VIFLDKDVEQYVEAEVDDVQQMLLRAGIDALAGWIKSKLRQRSRRKADALAAEREDETAIAELDQEREALLQGQVDEAAWKLYEREVRAVLELIEIRRNNLNLLENQRAQWGDALVPPVIVNGIRNETNELDALAARLQSLLQLIIGRPLPAAFTEALAAPSGDGPAEL
jgi:hypothetical protein